MVEEVKRLAVEYDAIEEPGTFTKERYETIDADVKRVGEALHEYGDVEFMRLTLDMYVKNAKLVSAVEDLQYRLKKASGRAQAAEA